MSKAKDTKQPMTWNHVIRQLYPSPKPYDYNKFIKKCLIAIFVTNDDPDALIEQHGLREFISKQFTEEEAKNKTLISDETLDALADFIFGRIISVDGDIYKSSRVKQLITLYTEQDHFTGEILVEAYQIAEGCEFFKTRQDLETFIKREYFGDAQVEIEFIKTLQRND